MYQHVMFEIVYNRNSLFSD